MRRMIGPLLVGVIGVAILIGLGIWQLERLKWKEAKLAAINAMLVDAPVALPVAPTPEADRYRGVAVAGRFTGEVLFKLDSLQDQGPGRRVIAVLQTPEGRRVLVDRGIWLDGSTAEPKAAHDAAVVGNLDWPQEADSFTPAPDAKTGLWFARDVPAMAKALGTEPVLVVARQSTGDGIIPMPLDTSAIPNDHWQYAMTWFSLALVWFVMTVFLLWRIRQQSLKAA
ncbi:SURF1 family protein [bacterium]|nr:SURF1 family protein [bacterium]